jgi:osmotically-inducible protein OsmY
MKSFKLCSGLLAVLVVVTLAGCRTTGPKSSDVTDSLRKSLDQAGLKDVTITQDRDKGIVTLGGHVLADADKTQAELIAKGIAPGQVIADQIVVTPPGGESDARAVNADFDKAIEKNLDAALIQRKIHRTFKYAVKNGVVTLTGEVDFQTTRDQAEQIANSIPNVKQVVNDLQTRHQKATSSK